jgi:predicted amidohydrolase
MSPGIRQGDSMEITVALAQMDVALGRPERNLEQAQALAAEAAGQGATLLLLPELWPTGYDLERAGEYARPLGEGAFAEMRGLAQVHSLYVAGTALEAQPGGRPFNTAALYDPEGRLAGAYRKVHLFPPMGEKRHMAAGESLPVFDLPWGPTALAICYDLRFPELWRRYMEAGAQLVLIPAEWPARRVEHWRLLLRARAVENQFFVAGCNRAGTDAIGTAGKAAPAAAALSYGGHSAAVDPWGRVLVEGGTEPGLHMATLDLSEVARSRGLLPFLDDRRPEVCD